uniref:Uncharacterized protein n=1 Tax=Catharus ustulatus TaxID=91951 RepID=A0A8C3VLI7_CATUS
MVLHSTEIYYYGVKTLLYSKHWQESQEAPLLPAFNKIHIGAACCSQVACLFKQEFPSMVPSWVFPYTLGSLHGSWHRAGHTPRSPVCSSSTAGIPACPQSSAGIPACPQSSAGIPACPQSSAGSCSSTAGIPACPQSTPGIPACPQSTAGIPACPQSSAGNSACPQSTAGIPACPQSSAGIPACPQSSAGIPACPQSTPGIPACPQSSAGSWHRAGHTLSPSSAGCWSTHRAQHPWGWHC